jgi:hypothetical protein
LMLERQNPNLESHHPPPTLEYPRGPSLRDPRQHDAASPLSTPKRHSPPSESKINLAIHLPGAAGPESVQFFRKTIIKTLS